MVSVATGGRSHAHTSTHTHTHTQPCMRLRVSCLPYAWPCLRPASPATDGRTTALASRSPHPSTAPLSSSSSRAACQQHATLAPDLQAAQSKRAERTCSSSAWGRLGAQQPASDAALGGQGVVHGTHMGTRSWSSSSTSMRAYIRSAIDTSKLDSRAGAVRTGTCTCTCTHTHTHAHARLSQHGRCTRRPKACKAGQLLQLGTASLSTQLHLRHVGLKCLGCICTSPHAHIHAHACAHASSHMLAQARTGVNICTCPFMERHTHTCADTLEEQKDLHRHTLTYAGMHARIDNCAHTETQTCSCTQGKLKACFRSRMD